MSESKWKEDIVKEKLGGKVEWTDEERVELSRMLDQEMEERFDKLILGKNKNSGGTSTAKKDDAWTEDNWKEKMNEHPIFAPFVNEGKDELVAPDNPLIEGLAQLKYGAEHNTPEEVARNYKEEGVHHFKYKRYKMAVASFSEGLRSKCTDSELLAQLLNNRAAAHYRMGNFRSAIRDCEQAVSLKPDYRKAIARAAESADRLGQWEELIRWCDRGLALGPSDSFFVDLRKAAVAEQKKCEMVTRKKLSVENKRLLELKHLVHVIKERGVTLFEDTQPEKKNDCQTEELDDDPILRIEKEISLLPNLEPTHPAAKGSKVHLNRANELVWPVILMYPEYQISDFIQHFNEKHSFESQLEVVFGEGSPPATWDKRRDYLLPRLAVFFEDIDRKKLVPVDITNTLRQVLADKRYIVKSGTPSFLIAVAGSTFLRNYLLNYH